MQIIITGASAGLGLEIARYCSDLGDEVVGIGRRKRSEIHGHSSLFKQYIQADLTKSNCDAILRQDISFEGTFGLVNNVGKSGWRSIHKVDDDFLQEMYKVNLETVFRMCRLVSKFSTLNSIVNVASIAGRRGSANNSVYSAMKFGVIGLTQSLAKELGSRNIRVNSVSPVLVTTPGLNEALAESDSPASEAGTENFLRMFTDSQSALKRLPTAREVAKAIRWLLSEDASAITGQNLNVDCGVFPQ
jgi:NAD(P)-dependent dehydrogenase (short-subunit alcohol dehydrogenase family)